MKITFIFLTSLVLAVGGCGGSGNSLPPEADDAIEAYADVVLASYEDSLAAAQAMKAAIDAFLADPNDTTLGAARDAWLEAREPYLETEVYRFYDGPIEEVEGQVNAWPLDEAYIDYVEGSPGAGIVNDPARTIDAAALLSLNEQGGEANIATGWHAIEFLLWGQDLSSSGPGARPATDYVAGVGANADRRRLYLQTVTDLLVADLEGLVAAWTEGVDGNYRERFVDRLSTRNALQRVFTGMVLLSRFETGGERLQPALDTQSQEEEHSCFSDNTHRDMVQDVQGVANAYRGSYLRENGTTISGTSVREVVAAVDPDLAATIDQRITQALLAAEAIMPPFDQEILLGNPDGRLRVEELSLALVTLGNELENAMLALGYGSVVTPE